VRSRVPLAAVAAAARTAVASPRSSRSTDRAQTSDVVAHQRHDPHGRAPGTDPAIAEGITGIDAVLKACR